MILLVDVLLNLPADEIGEQHYFLIKDKTNILFYIASMLSKEKNPQAKNYLVIN